MKTLRILLLSGLMITIMSINVVLAQRGSSTSRDSGSSSSSQSTVKGKSSTTETAYFWQQSSKKGNRGNDTIRRGNKLSRTIEFKGEKNKEEIIYPVGEKDTELSVNINMKISDGELVVELYDPSGEKAGNCSVNCTLSSDDDDDDEGSEKNASCSFSKSYSPPLPGSWKIIFVNKNAKGTLELEIN